MSQGITPIIFGSICGMVANLIERDTPAKEISPMVRRWFPDVDPVDLEDVIETACDGWSRLNVRTEADVLAALRTNINGQRTIGETPKLRR
jgi:hypothetical protein